MSPEKLARFADSWKYFVCPLCREELRLEGTSLRCERGHTYDVARQGYVNLAPGARQSEYYSRESFEHRGQILSAGYYSHIVDAVLSAVGRYCGQIAASIDFAGLRTRSGAQLRGARGRADLRSSGPQMRAPVILDVGCGEGFYARAVQAAHPDATVLAFDISKDSVQLAAREDAGCAVRWFVGNLAELPVRDGAVDCVLDVFSPVNYAEFTRVLGGSGVVIKVVPGARHDEQLRELASFCVAKANTAVYQRALQDPAYQGMGTTLVSAVAEEKYAIVCNIGDSRAYLIRGGEITRITHDHSVVQTLVENGNITAEEARTHPNRNLITRALGPDENTLCDAFEVSFTKGDKILLCTDGLVVTATDDEICRAVCAGKSAEESLDDLIALAKAQGAPDNVTAVLIEHE